MKSIYRIKLPTPIQKSMYPIINMFRHLKTMSIKDMIIIPH